MATTFSKIFGLVLALLICWGQLAYFSSSGGNGGLFQSLSSTTKVEVLTQNSTYYDGDVAILITSGWVPSHPSTYLVETVINSTNHLIGLHPSTPIIITIDQLNSDEKDSDDKEKMKALEAYTLNLTMRYMTNPRIHILPAMMNLHLGGNVMKAIHLIEQHYPTVEYLYSLQHDISFTKDIDHISLVDVMKKNFTNITTNVNYILFHNKLQHGCGNDKDINYTRTKMVGEEVGLNLTDSEKKQLGEQEIGTLYPTHRYSDRNHLVRFPWYSELITSIIFYHRFPEGPLQVRANAGCASNNSIGLYLYEENSIAHLNGRGFVLND